MSDDTDKAAETQLKLFDKVAQIAARDPNTFTSASARERARRMQERARRQLEKMQQGRR